MRKLLKSSLSIGALALAFAPLSCSTTWMKWNVNNETPNETDFGVERAPNGKWKVRTHQELMNAPIIVTTNELIGGEQIEVDTIDLSLLNNHYELHYVLSSAVNLRTPDFINNSNIDDFTPDGKKDPIDMYWKSGSQITGLPYRGMRNYLSQIQSKGRVILKYGDSTVAKHTVDFDFNKITTRPSGVATINIDSLNKAIASIDNYNWDRRTHAYDVESTGVDVTSIPNRIDEITQIADKFMSNALVQTILLVNNTYALQMAKLTNLPQIAFDEFETIMQEIDRIIFGVYRSVVYKYFETEKEIDYTISDTTGKLGAYPAITNTGKRDFFIGKFMVNAIGK